MNYTVDGWNNFCRVFEIPELYPEGYVSGGGKPVSFMMVDWLNPVEGLDIPGVLKEVWIEEVGEIRTKEVSEETLYETLIPFLLEKKYVRSGRDYLVLCDFGAAIRFSSPYK